MEVNSVFVVIPNWNGRLELRKCLISLRGRALDPRCSAVVVDNASSDKSVHMIENEFRWVTLIKNEENWGFSRASNQGIKYAMKHGATHIFLVNNDIEFTEGKWLDKLLALCESDPQIGIVGCKLLYPDGKIQHAGGIVELRGIRHRGHCEKDNGQYDNVEVVDYVTGAALLIKTELVRKIGLLDEGFSPFYFEETDWCARAAFKGYKVVYTPHPEFIHKESATVKSVGSKKADFYFRRNWIRFILLNFGLGKICKRIVLYEPRDMLDAVIEESRTGKFPFKIKKEGAINLIIITRAWFSNLKNLNDINVRRKQRFNEM